MPQAKGVLPGDIPIRGARAQHCATVRPENKVCRVCGSHPAVRAGGHVRVGLEDAPLGCAAGNTELVERAARLIEAAGGRLATGAQVRAAS